MRRGRVAGSATIRSARTDRHDLDGSDPFWWQDAAEHVIGSTSWALTLEVQLPGRPPYTTAGTWRVPNRLWKVRKILDGPGRLLPGMVVPVVVDPSHPDRVEIDWKAFKRTGADAQLYPDTGSVRRELATFVRELRDDPGAAERAEPSTPRPTATSHPPIEGIDYDTWIGAVVDIVRNRVRRRGQVEVYARHGLPPDRAEAISAAWYDRVKGDPVLSSWYIHDCDHLQPPGG